MRFTDQSSHWYHRDGRTAHGATLREARKLGLLPSVSAILKCWPNDGLRNWLRGQDVMAAATTPRLPHETDDAWLARVIHAADEESAKARETGLRRHQIIEQFNKNQKLDTTTDDYSFIEPYLKWCRENVAAVLEAESIIVNPTYGYGGTADLRVQLNNGRYATVDIKNRKRVCTYDSDGMQLAAYTMRDMRDGIKDAMISLVLGTEKPEILAQDWSLSRMELERCFLLCLDMWQASKNYYPTRTQQPEPVEAA